MFRARETVPWMYGLCSIGLALIFLGMRRGLDDHSGMGAFSVCVVGFCALLGPGMLFYLRNWFTWQTKQHLKPTLKLKAEAVEHPFQPRYETSESFNSWAKQFLTDGEVEPPHKKYAAGAAPGNAGIQRTSLQRSGDMPTSATWLEQ